MFMYILFFLICITIAMIKNVGSATWLYITRIYISWSIQFLWRYAHFYFIFYKVLSKDHYWVKRTLIKFKCQLIIRCILTSWDFKCRDTNKTVPHVINEILLKTYNSSHNKMEKNRTSVPLLYISSFIIVCFA